MDLERVDYNKLNSIAPFSIYIFEYFKNDFIVISDFLKAKSPWDSIIKCFLKLDDEQLIEKKKQMLTSIFDVYFDIIEAPIIEQSDQNFKVVNIVDYYFLEALKVFNNRVDMFFNDDRVVVIMCRVYLSVLQEKYNINIDTGNYYLSDLLSIINFYKILYSNFKGTKKFLDDITNILDNYLNKSFRNRDELAGFINYSYSIIYAFLKIKKIDEEYLSDEEEQIIYDYDNIDSDLVDIYLNSSYGYKGTFIVDLYAIYVKYGDKLDIRNNLTDSKSQTLFEERDVNYNNVNKTDFVIDDFSLEFKLEELMSYLMTIDKEQVYYILTSKESIYNMLYNVDLDGRYSDHYKDKIIRKMICDVYGYCHYLYSQGETSLDDIINVINNINFNDETYVNTFSEHFDMIYELYLKFMSSSEYIKEQMYFYLYNPTLLNKLDRINNFNIINYFDIMIGRIKQLKSVDYLNEYINNSKDYNEEMIYDDKLISLIALNVYENIVLSSELSSNNDRIKMVIEEVSDISLFAQNSKPFLRELIKLFDNFNKDNITYESEIAKRKIINKPILNSLNPFDE